MPPVQVAQGLAVAGVAGAAGKQPEIAAIVELVGRTRIVGAKAVAAVVQGRQQQALQELLPPLAAGGIDQAGGLLLGGRCRLPRLMRSRSGLNTNVIHFTSNSESLATPTSQA
jgi:hypothetical protein